MPLPSDTITILLLKVEHACSKILCKYNFVQDHGELLGHQLLSKVGCQDLARRTDLKKKKKMV